MHLGFVAIAFLLTAPLLSARIAAADVGPGGEWVLTGSPTSPAEGTPITLQDGTARLIGKLVQRYDTDTGDWTPAGSLLGNGGVVTLLSNGKVLVTGLSPAEVYDPATATSALTGTMFIPRTGHQATQLQSGDVLVSGGTDANGQLVGPAELFHPSTDAWTLTGALNNPRTDHTAILLPTGKVLVAGGVGTDVRFSSAELYDAARGIWAITSPNAVGGSVSALLPGGQALVVGTDNLARAGPTFPASQFYDSTTGTWSASVVVPIVFSQDFVTPSTLGTLTDGRVLLASHSHGAPCNPFMYFFDPNTGAWTSASNPPLGASEPRMTILPDGRALLVGSCSVFGPFRFPTAELFRPDNSTPRLALTPPTVDFGAVAIGSSTQQTITVQNTGQAQLNGSAVVSGGSSPLFQLLTGAAFNLGPGATLAATVRFTASDFGSFDGSVSFMSNGGWATSTLKANVGVQLSGRITGADGLGVASIPVELHGVSSASTTSDANGRYSFFVQPNGGYTVIPASPIMSFTPPSRSISVGTDNVSGLDFTAAVVDALAAFVAGLYENVLKRAPDPSGLTAWTGFLRDNCNPNGFSSAAQGFFDSQEFRTSRPLTLSGLVSVLYRTFLAREPEPGGLAAWADVLRQARFGLIQDFILSAEFQSLLPDRTSRPAVTAVVTRFYTEILGRAPEPEGLTAWVDYIVATRDLEGAAVAFVASAEFQGRALTFRDYVGILYRGVLGRAPDPDGLDAWENVLRSDLLLVLNGGFIPSAEFQRRIPQVCGS